jgi:hypothetical protein
VMGDLEVHGGAVRLFVILTVQSPAPQGLAVRTVRATPTVSAGWQMSAVHDWALAQLPDAPGGRGWNTVYFLAVPDWSGPAAAVAAEPDSEVA